MMMIDDNDDGDDNMIIMMMKTQNLKYCYSQNKIVVIFVCRD